MPYPISELPAHVLETQWRGRRSKLAERALAEAASLTPGYATDIPHLDRNGKDTVRQAIAAAKKRRLLAPTIKVVERAEGHYGQGTPAELRRWTVYISYWHEESQEMTGAAS